MNILCDGVDIGATSVEVERLPTAMTYVSLYEKSPPPVPHITRMVFCGPVDPSMPTEGIHVFRVSSLGGSRTFRAEAEHIPAHKKKGSRIAAPCPVCDNEECCNAVWENYEYDVPAKTYWNVLKEGEE